MKPITRNSPVSGARNDFAHNNMNSSGGSNDNFTNPGFSYSSLPYYMYNSSSGGENSSNYNYNYSASNSYSTSNYPTNSYRYESQGQSSSNFQYNPIISSEASSHVPFSYANNKSNSNKKRNHGNQQWVKRDSLKRPTPYAGDRGINLMQKMGWNPGQGLGRCENGALEPLFPDIKMNKRGLDVTQKNLKFPFSKKVVGGRKLQITPIKLVTEGKNPVSILEEYCSKRKLEAPKYEAVVDDGPVHAKNFVFKVTVDGVEHTADKGSNVKKTARMEAAKKCLIELSILSKE